MIRIILIVLISFASLVPYLVIFNRWLNVGNDLAGWISMILGWVITPVLLLHFWKGKSYPEELPERVVINDSEVIRDFGEDIIEKNNWASREVRSSMKESEVATLRKVLKAAPSQTKKVSQGAVNALVLWAAFSLVLIIIWLVIAKIFSWVATIDIGLQSQYSFNIIVLIVLSAASYAIFSSIKWVRDWPEYYPRLDQDIENRIINDKRFTVIEVKVFEEPEHGGRMHMLLMDDGRVYSIYDYESVIERIGPEEEIAFLKPRKELRILSAPLSGYIFSQEFSGEALAIPIPIELTVPPSQWPEDDSWCDIAWSDLEKTLCS